MKLAPYGCYTIQAETGTPEKDGYIHIPGASLEANRQITLWGFDTRGVDFTDHFEFVLVPVAGADDTYYIVNRRSGLALVVWNGAVVQAVPGKDPRTGEEDELHARSAQFVFEPSRPAVYLIANQLTGTYLAAKDDKTANGTPLVALPALEKDNSTSGSKHFRLTHVVGLMGKIPVPEAGAGRRFPQLKNLRTDLPLQTDPLLREVEVVPFFAINDPVYPRHRQVAVSPYYTLGRSTTWLKVSDRQLDGIVERETTDTAETGLTTMAAESVRSTFSTSLSTTAKASYKGFGFSASVSVTAKLAMESERSAQRSTESHEAHVFTETILYPAIGKPYRLAKWRPIDRYELRRKDSSLVASWDALRSEEEVIDVFPRTAAVPEPRMATSEADRRARDKTRKELAAAG